MSKKILIDAVYPEETRVVIYENNLIQEFDYETASKKQIKGYIYLAKVTRVEPGLQAAFVEYSPGKHGFLPFSEIHPDYFHIPISDRQKYKNIDNLLQEEFKDSNKFELPDFRIDKLPQPAADHYDIKEPNQEEANIDIEEPVSYEEGHEEVTEEGEFAEKFPYNDNNISTIENIESEDNIETQYYPILDIYKDYKIHEVIKRNQIILVQAIKEERGNKGASFTSYVSLAGRYCVFMPNSNRQGGISRRIVDLEDRKRIKEIIDELNLNDGSSIIVRTAGAGKDKAEIQRDYEYLSKLWHSIRENTLNSTAPAFIHAESDIIKRTIRDLYDENVGEVMIQGDSAFSLAKDFMHEIIPHHLSKVKQYKNKTPIFCRYQIEEQLASLYSPIAHLQSGGYIVINHTEALISIDVNSGKSTSERNVEETAFKTNYEAIVELTRQLRLRDLSGLIIIDFIDMMDIKNKRLIEKTLRDFLKIDRAKIQVGNISEFGLVEMSRQRLRSNFLEANTVSCAHCNGKGTTRTAESNSVMILRTIESEIYKGDFEVINIYAAYDAIIYLLNNKRNDILAIEKKYSTKLMFNNDPLANGDSFSIERIKKPAAYKNNALSKKLKSEPTQEEQLNNDYNISGKKINQDLKTINTNDDAKEERAKKPSRKILKRKITSLKKIEPDEVKLPENNENKSESENLPEASPAVKKRKKKISNYRKKRQALKEDKPVESESLLKGFWKKILE